MSEKLKYRKKSVILCRNCAWYYYTSITHLLYTPRWYKHTAETEMFPSLNTFILSTQTTRRLVKGRSYQRVWQNCTIIPQYLKNSFMIWLEYMNLWTLMNVCVRVYTAHTVNGLMATNYLLWMIKIPTPLMLHR